MNTKAGYAAIIGLPNVGKSTLMNALLGQKISITTSKPQTTRKRILGILSEENYQVVFLDTPGILKPAYLLQEKMMDDIDLSVKDADVFVIIYDVSSEQSFKGSEENEYIQKVISEKKNPKILVLNKIDTISQAQALSLIERFEKLNIFKSVIPVSANLKFNLERLLNDIVAVSYTHLRAHETVLDLVCRLLLEKKKNNSSVDNSRHLLDNTITLYNHKYNFNT